MFKNDFQGGSHFEIFSATGKDSLSGWKLLNSSGIKKIYDKEVKGYVYTMEGTSATTKIQIPKDSKHPLTLIQRYLIIQLYLVKGQEFSIELGVTDLHNNKRRIQMSTAQKETQVTPLHARIPFSVVRKAIWLNLCLDMVSLVGETWRGETYRSIETLAISANCKLKRVFSMKTQPTDTTEDDEMYGTSNPGEVDTIPARCQLPTDVTQTTQILTMSKIRHGDRPVSNLNLDSSLNSQKLSSSQPYQIAFGSKVPVDTDTRKSARQGSVTNRSARSTSSRMEDGTGSLQDLNGSGTSHSGMLSSRDLYADSAQSRAHAHKTKADLDENENQHGVSKGVKEGAIVTPHPPREPSSDRRRRRPRVKNVDNKDRQSSAGSVKEESLNESDISYQTVTNTSDLYSGGQAGDRDMSDFSSGEAVSVWTNPALQDDVQQSVSRRIPVERREFPSLQGPTRLKKKNPLRTSLDKGVGPDVPEIQTPTDLDLDVNDSISDVIGLLKFQSYKGHNPLDARFESKGHNSLDTRFESKGHNSLDTRFESKGHNSLDTRFESKGHNSLDTRFESKGHNPLDTRFESKGHNPLDTRFESKGHNPLEGGDSSDPESVDSVVKSYESSDEYLSSENRLHVFFVPPSSAPHRNVSPNTAETEVKQTKKSRSQRSSTRSTLDSVSSRGARLEDDFINNFSSSDEETPTTSRHRKTGSRPHSGTSNTSSPKTRGGMGSAGKRGDSGGRVRGDSGGRVRGDSGGRVRGDSGSKVRGDSGGRTRGAVTTTPKVSSISPEQRGSQFNPALYSDAHGANLMSRMSLKNLVQIPSNDARISHANVSQRPYDFTKYQMADMTTSDEARMFLSMQRQQEEDSPESPRRYLQSVNCSPRRTRHGAENTADHEQMYSESPTTTSDDDTSFSTWKAPAPNHHHNYQDEMKSRLSSDTLTSSNPRDWSGVYSPPIVLPGDLNNTGHMVEDIPESSSITAVSVGTARYDGSVGDDAEDDNVNLLYDPSLNCYFDPVTRKYYELKGSPGIG